MIKKEIDRGTVLQSELLERCTKVGHYFSLRQTQKPGDGVWMPKQVHGTDIVIVTPEMPLDESAELQPVEADAVITTRKELWIGVRTADCVPVLLCDTEKKVIAAVHAGWRGTVQHIVKKVVMKMSEEFGCNASDILAAIGPSISPESFEVGEEVALAFQQAGREDCVLRQIWGNRGMQPLSKPHIDLWQSNVMDLLEAGVDLQHIDCTPLCTYQNYQDFYSARKEGIETGRIVSAIRFES